MTSNPMIDFVPTTIIHDETSNQSIEIPDPPSMICPTNNPSGSSAPTIQVSPSNSDDDDTEPDSDDDETTLPIDFTFDWLDAQMRAGVDLRPLLARVLPGLPEDVSQATIYEILMDLFLPIRQRRPLEQYKTLDDAVNLIRTCKNILVLTGAGISVSCGIPDFRSRNGIYARLREEFPELPNPQSMFDIEYFTHDPRPFFRFAKEIWPGQYQPSLAHYFIAELEQRSQLLRNYTQNIDSLEHLCSISRLIQCHGSFSTATCRICHNRVKSDDIKNEILSQTIPYCLKCNTEAIIKPDIVFFGEPLGEEFHKTISIDKDKCDLLIVMGSSLKVKPVSLVSEILPSHIPQILINRERLPHKIFDIELLGDCDGIINEICLRLAKQEPSFGKIQRLEEKNIGLLKEILYENLRLSVRHKQQKRKKKRKISSTNTNESSTTSSLPQERLSSLRPRQFKPTTITTSPTSSSSRKRPFSALKNSSLYNTDSSFVYYPPRRYLFTGAEISLSSSSSSSDDESDDDNGLRRVAE